MEHAGNKQNMIIKQKRKPITTPKKVSELNSDETKYSLFS